MISGKRKDPYSRLDDRNDRFHASRHPAHPLRPEAERPLQAELSMLLPDAGALLDLMSGANCYMPPGPQIVGLDVDEAGLARNPALMARVVANLNATPALPFASASFNGAACVSGVQYLTSPVAVFREIHRVLAPGSPFVVAYTDVFFPAKAIAVWSLLYAPQRAALVSSYFREAGGWTGTSTRSLDNVVHLVWAHKL
jgi:SAM-dependent methyltransferase